MAQGPETRLVAAIRRAILERHPAAWTFKVHGNPYQDAGVPDLLVCIEGHLLALEVKAPRPGESREHALGRVTARQQATLDRLARAGAVVGVALSVKDALNILSSLGLTREG